MKMSEFMKEHVIICRPGPVREAEYKVMAGDLLLGRTSSYEEAVKWKQTHDLLRANGPIATIEEVRP